LTPYDPTLFEGSAAHYTYGRPPYSPQLEAVLTEELGLDGSGRLLDGGCGPGILTIRLAHLFEDVVGLDPDAAMLAEGRRVADEREVANIRWVRALAEELPEAAPGPYRLVTFGQSFHLTDETRVAEALYDMLEPAGAAEPRAAAHPARRDRGADREAPRPQPAPRARANPSLRGHPRPHTVRRAAGYLRPRHPGPRPGQRERLVGLLLALLLDAATVRRPGGGLRRRGA